METGYEIRFWLVQKEAPPSALFLPFAAKKKTRTRSARPGAPLKLTRKMDRTEGLRRTGMASRIC